MTDKTPTPMLTIKSQGQALAEVFLLNPGEAFPGFGGSRHPLIVGESASLIVRSRSGGTMEDVEYDIDDKSVWAWIARMINREAGDITAEGPAKADTVVKALGTLAPRIDH